jgi:hypothetical protein
MTLRRRAAFAASCRRHASGVTAGCAGRRSLNRAVGIGPEAIAMRSVNIHHAKTHLSRLVEEAAKGELNRPGFAGGLNT